MENLILKKEANNATHTHTHTHKHGEENYVKGEPCCFGKKMIFIE